jgi:guanyl-specific ribonuclease Sa
MAVAGRDPHYAIDFWQRMSKANRGGHPPEFMSTHPSDDRRVHDLEAHLSEAMDFYARAPQQIPDRPLPLDGTATSSTEPRETRTSSSSNGEWNTKLPAESVPRKVALVLKSIDENHQAPEGYEGGRKFLNLGRDGEQVLPRTDAQGNAIAYQEWDVDPLVPGRNRGAERLVTGSDGSAFYTPNHYRSFLRLR